jgi:hypothetical protein
MIIHSPHKNAFQFQQLKANQAQVAAELVRRFHGSTIILFVWDISTSLREVTSALHGARYKVLNANTDPDISGFGTEYNVLISSPVIGAGVNIEAEIGIILGLERGLTDIDPFEFYQTVGRFGRFGYDVPVYVISNKEIPPRDFTIKSQMELFQAVTLYPFMPDICNRSLNKKLNKVLVEAQAKRFGLLVDGKPSERAYKLISLGFHCGDLAWAKKVSNLPIEAIATSIPSAPYPRKEDKEWGATFLEEAKGLLPSDTLDVIIHQVAIGSRIKADGIIPQYLEDDWGRLKLIGGV